MIIQLNWSIRDDTLFIIWLAFDIADAKKRLVSPFNKSLQLCVTVDVFEYLQLISADVKYK